MSLFPPALWGLISIEHCTLSCTFLLLLNEPIVVPRGGLTEAGGVNAQSSTETKSHIPQASRAPGNPAQLA